MIRADFTEKQSVSQQISENAWLLTVIYALAGHRYIAYYHAIWPFFLARYPGACFYIGPQWLWVGWSLTR